MIDSCSWNDPGANPFMGSVPEAVQQYKDIPSPVRAKLIKAMKDRVYTDIVLITRTKLEGVQKIDYTGDITHMHFGNGSICKGVDRSKWKDTQYERGLVYCVENYCVMVPTVCRNVSRIYMMPFPPGKEDEPVVPKAQVVNTVPEPSTYALVLLALGGLYLTKRKMK